MPLPTLGTELIVAARDRTLACAARGELHHEHRQREYHEEYQVQHDERRAAVLAGDIGESPYVSQADGAARAHQDKPKARTKPLTFHENPFQSKTRGPHLSYAPCSMLFPSRDFPPRDYGLWRAQPPARDPTLFATRTIIVDKAARTHDSALFVGHVRHVKAISRAPHLHARPTPECSTGRRRLPRECPERTRSRPLQTAGCP